MQHKNLIIHVLTIPVIFISSLATADPGKTIIATELKHEPYIDATTTAKLDANTQLEVLKRQGGWMQVKAAAGEGWLKMTSIRLGAATVAKGDSGLGSLAKVALTGRSGNTGVTATTGVRGLSPEELKNAAPNPAAVQQLDQFVAEKNQTQSFANVGRLQAQTVEYLDTVVARQGGQ